MIPLASLNLNGVKWQNLFYLANTPIQYRPELNVNIPKTDHLGSNKDP